MQISSLGGGHAAAMIQQVRERAFARADADQSGGLSLEEFKAVSPRGRAGSAEDTAASAGTRTRPTAETVFASIDADGDGSLTAQEMAAARPPGGFGPPGSRGLGGSTLAALLGTQERHGAAGTHGRRPEAGTATDGAGAQAAAAYGGAQAAPEGGSVTTTTA